jgi:hypothetical protein
MTLADFHIPWFHALTKLTSNNIDLKRSRQREKSVHGSKPISSFLNRSDGAEIENSYQNAT